MQVDSEKHLVGKIGERVGSVTTYLCFSSTWGRLSIPKLQLWARYPPVPPQLLLLEPGAETLISLCSRRHWGHLWWWWGWWGPSWFSQGLRRHKKQATSSLEDWRYLGETITSCSLVEGTLGVGSNPLKLSHTEGLTRWNAEGLSYTSFSSNPESTTD